MHSDDVGDNNGAHSTSGMYISCMDVNVVDIPNIHPQLLLSYGCKFLHVYLFFMS